MAGEPRLSRGDEGEWVEYLQRMLAHRGYDPGAADGVFASGTEDMVRAFQAEHGLPVDGAVADATWEALTGAGTDSGATAGDVPAEFVQAGAPPNVADWTEEQKQAYFVGEVTDSVEGDAGEELPVAEIEGGDDEGGS